MFFFDFPKLWYYEHEMLPFRKVLSKNKIYAKTDMSVQFVEHCCSVWTSPRRLEVKGSNLSERIYEMHYPQEKMEPDNFCYFQFNQF